MRPTWSRVCRRNDLTCWGLPDWKKEGYCEYIAGSPSMDADEGRRLIREGRTESSGPFRYSQYRLMVEYLIEVEAVGIVEIVAREFDRDELVMKFRRNPDRL